jgi:hypothetical protein
MKTSSLWPVQGVTLAILACLSAGSLLAQPRSYDRPRLKKLQVGDSELLRGQRARLREGNRIEFDESRAGTARLGEHDLVFKIQHLDQLLVLTPSTASPDGSARLQAFDSEGAKMRLNDLRQNAMELELGRSGDVIRTSYLHRIEGGEGWVLASKDQVLAFTPDGEMTSSLGTTDWRGLEALAIRPDGTVARPEWMRR